MINLFQAYYNFTIVEIAENVYRIVPIEKVGNNKIFNRIFSNGEVQLRQFQNNAMHEYETQFIITERINNDIIPLCVLTRSTVAGTIKFIPMTQARRNIITLPKVKFGLAGTGKFNYCSQDLIFYRLNPKTNVFEVFISNGNKSKAEEIFSMYINGELNEEIEKLSNFCKEFGNEKRFKSDN